MIKRLAKIILFLPVICVSIIEIIYYIFRWIYNGKEIPDPYIINLVLFEW